LSCFCCFNRAGSENSNGDSQEALSTGQDSNLRMSAEPMEWGSVTPSPRGTPEHPASGGGGGPLDNFSAVDSVTETSCGGSPLIKDYLPQEFPRSEAGSRSATFTDPDAGLDNRQKSSNLIDNE